MHPLAVSLLGLLGGLGLMGCTASPISTPSGHTVILVFTIAGEIEVHTRPSMMVLQPSICHPVEVH